MKFKLNNILGELLGEGLVRSTLPLDKRIEIVADKVMEYMDNFNTIYIPDYRFLQDWKPKENDTFRPNMKYLLQKYIRRSTWLSTFALSVIMFMKIMMKLRLNSCLIVICVRHVL